jgi:hypothetical protein
LRRITKKVKRKDRSGKNMSRTRLGAHGKVCERLSGKWLMTIRPNALVLNDEDIAILLGTRIGAVYQPSYDSAPQTFAEGMASIFAWERDNGNLTQAGALALIHDSWDLANFEMGSDAYQYFDDDNELHRAMLMKVQQIWPAFTNPPTPDGEE